MRHRPETGLHRLAGYRWQNCRGAVTASWQVRRLQISKGTQLDIPLFQTLDDMRIRQRRQFILDASQGMAADAVLDLVKAASGEGAPVSKAMLRMLTKMGHHAERLPENRKPLAEVELREQVGELVRGWALTDPNPDGYALALQKMAQSAPTLVAAEDVRYAPEPERILQMACEVNAVGDALDRAVDALVLGQGAGAVADTGGGDEIPF